MERKASWKMSQSKKFLEDQRDLRIRFVHSDTQKCMEDIAPRSRYNGNEKSIESYFIRLYDWRLLSFGLWTSLVSHPSPSLGPSNWKYYKGISRGHSDPKSAELPPVLSTYLSSPHRSTSMHEVLCRDRDTIIHSRSISKPIHCPPILSDIDILQMEETFNQRASRLTSQIQMTGEIVRITGRRTFNVHLLKPTKIGSGIDSPTLQSHL